MYSYQVIRMVTAVVAGTLLSLLAMGCGSDGPTPTPTTATVAAPAETGPTAEPVQTAQPQLLPEYGGTLVTVSAGGGGGSQAYLDTYDVRSGGHSVMGWLVHNGLIQQKYPFDPQKGAEYETVLATEYTQDGGKWTFKLRRDVTFHDGEVFNADDVVATVQRILDEEYLLPPANLPMRSIFKNVSKLDEYTVVLDTGEPDATAFAWISGWQMPMVPAHIITGDPSAADVNDRWKFMSVGSAPGSTASLAIGTGPFRPTKHVVDTELILERNENYFRFDEHGNRLPYLDKIHQKRVPDQIRRRALFVAGGLSILGELGFKQSNEICQSVKGTDGCYSTERPWGIFSFVNNVKTTPFFEDDRANQATRYAMDYKALFDTVYGPQRTFKGGHASIWIDRTLHPDSTISIKEQHELMPWTDPTRREEFTQKAKDLIVELGYSDGYKPPQPFFSGGLCFGIFLDHYGRMVDTLREIGIDTFLECRQGIVANEELKAGRWSMVGPGKSYELIDPSYMFTRFGILNSPLVGNAPWRWGPAQEAADALFQKTIRIADAQVRNENWKELERIYAQDTLSVHSQGFNVNYLPVLGCVNNFNPGGNSVATYWSFERTWLTKACRDE